MTYLQPRFYAAVIVFATVLLCIVVYLPGISGPWIFDDYPNIIHNSYVRLSSLDFSGLHGAAFSMESGPLRRPIPVMSFALNHYFAGDLSDTTPFKVTNLVIHILNTLLVFWLAVLILLRIGAKPHYPTKRTRQPHNAAYLIAACIALIWSIHPLQLTSVLYVVQRMTELAATFALLGLICYLHGRMQMLAGHKARGLWFVLLGLIGFGTLGILSKENAALMPLFAVLLEFILFQDELPLRHWQKLSARRKRAVWMAAGLIVLVALLWAINYALPRYESREFTMSGRLLTEARVLFFYLSLLFVPDIARLGHQHDDIAISSSLVAPITTLPSVFGIIVLIVAGLWLRRRNLLLSLGILWFLIGHLMESTIYPLEIAHEHRNYLPSFGFALGVGSVLACHAPMAQRRMLIWVAFAVIVIAYAGTTYLRSSQWSDYNTFYRYEVAHHPQSARTQAGYSVLLEAQGRFEEAQAATQRAATLSPIESGYVMDVMLLDARQKRTPNPADQAEVLHRLQNGKITATTILTMDSVDGCLQTWCSALIPNMEQWIETILLRPDAPDPYYFRYRLGRIKAIQRKYEEALNLFQQAHEADRHFLHPLFEQINIFLKLGQTHNAEYVLARLKDANAQGRYRRDREIAIIEADIERLKIRPR